MIRVRIASAGTGKTHSLVEAYLEALADHPPERLWAVTFTRAAAGELRSRLEGRLRAEGKEALAHRVRAYTIHGFFAELLRVAAPWVALDPEFERVEAPEAELFFAEEARTRLFLEDAEEWLEELLKLYQKRSLAPELEPSGTYSRRLYRWFSAVEQSYLARLAGRLLGPIEIERKAYDLLRLAGQHEALARRLKARVHQVFVDEYQDTSPLQGEIFNRLADLGVALYLVGDPKQSIYAFRNADVEVFREAARRGERLPPLTTTRRHPPALADFLNRLTEDMGRENLGFSQDEVEPVVSAVSGEAVVGLLRVEDPEERLDNLRRVEAHWLAKKLRDLADQKAFGYAEMAVLIRGYDAVRFLAPALRRLGVPFVVVGGQGLFRRPEVMDLRVALAAALDPEDRMALLGFLQSPFVGLGLTQALAAARAEDPSSRLSAPVAAYLEEVRQRARRLAPLEFLEWLVRTPGPGGSAFLETLTPVARANVDAVLFKLARRRYRYLALLVTEFDRLAQAEDEGPYVEGSAEAVKLVTIHQAKGLEWPLVWAFDLNRGSGPNPDPLYVRPRAGAFAVREDGEPYELYKKEWQARERDEANRLLYVALSRAQRYLAMSYSVGGPQAKPRPGKLAYPLERFQVASWEEVQAKTLREPPRRLPRQRAGAASVRPPLDPVPPAWDRPLVTSPSALLAERPRGGWGEEAPAEPGAGPVLGRAVGVLVHHAIGHDWPLEERHLEALGHQEVMLGFSEEERARILARVRELLAHYQAMLGEAIPALSEREEDRAELPFAWSHPEGRGVIEGIIDRLYRAGGVYYLEDYKTDAPAGDLLDYAREKGYDFQLAVYARAVEDALGVTPRVRLVFLAKKEVVELSKEVLEAAFQSSQLA